MILRLCILSLLGVLSAWAEPSQVIQNLKAGKPQTLVMYGTSLTAGGTWVEEVKKSLESQFPGKVTVINSGKGAMWSEWGRTNVEDLVIAHKPDAVFIEFGINDAYEEHKCSLEEAEKNLNEIIDKILAENPRTEIFLMTMNPPVNNSSHQEPRGPHLDRRPNYEAYYDVYRKTASARGLRLIDNHRDWISVMNRNMETFWKWVPDGIHPNKEGNYHVTTPNILAALFGTRK